MATGLVDTEETMRMDAGKVTAIPSAEDASLEVSLRWSPSLPKRLGPREY